MCQPRRMEEARQHWSRDYFDEWYLRLFGRPDENRTDQETAALCTLLPPPPCRVLDAACGFGRHAVRLASAGYDVVGVDSSPHQLSLAREAAEQRGVAVEFLQIDMADMAFGRQFDAVLNLSTAWGYSEDDEENLETLRAMVRSLRPGGIFVMEIAHRDAIVAHYASRDWRELDDGTIVWISRSFDPVAGVNVVVHRWRTPDGSEYQREHRVRLFTPTEIDRLFRAAGLVPTEWYDGFSLRNLRLGGSNHLLVRALAAEGLRH